MKFIVYTSPDSKFKIKISFFLACVWGEKDFLIFHDVERKNGE
jgi:hypothetical protein